MSDPLAECLTEAEIALDDRDHCQVDLRSCRFALGARTPTTAAHLVAPPVPPPEPAPGLDLPLAVSLIASGLIVGALAGALLAR